ncbi:hypothetical protein HMPREF1633_05420 [Tissierellia bacterium S5-A11]|nr:hypothetical protein HMPREF1633_05420 [Tissierellia bacterium S5-A11]
MKEILLAYFSRSGVTKKLSEDLAKVLDAEIYQVRPLKAYPLEEEVCIQVAEREKAEEARPGLAGPLPEVRGLKKLVLGLPNWNDTCPRCLLSFLEALDLSGVEVYPFVTSEGSGPDGVNEDLQEQVKRTAKLHKAANGDQLSVEDLAAWVRGGKLD